MREGDSERGRRLFSAEGLGCAKCHALQPDAAVQGGPSLTGASARFTLPYLVESILLPSRQVSPIFKATVLTTDEGQVLTGLVINETAEKVELLTTEAQRIMLEKSSIEQRVVQEISPMPAGLVRKPDEMIDLLAFLLQQSPEIIPGDSRPPDSGADK